jgi:hypothetical protein
MYRVEKNSRWRDIFLGAIGFEYAWEKNFAMRRSMT